MATSVHRTPSRFPGWGQPVAVLSVGLGLTAALVAWTWNESRQRDAERLDAMLEQYRQELETRVEHYEMTVLHTAEWLAERELPSETQWLNRLERIKPEVNFPAMIELSFAPELTPENVERWKGRIPEEWLAKGAQEKQELRAWYYHALPPGSADRRGWDFLPFLGDMMDSNHFFHTTGVRSTGRRLVPAREPGRELAAFALVAGVFRTDLPPVTPRVNDAPGFQQAGWPRARHDQRRAASLGILMGVVAIDPLLDSIFGGRRLEIDCDLYAGEAVEPNRMTRLELPAMKRTTHPLMRELVLPWYTQRWRIVAGPNEAFWRHSHRRRVWVVGLAGCLLALASAGLARTQVKARRAAEAWGASLQSARDELRIAHRERLVLSRNLHDGAMQNIYACLLGLKRARRALERSPESVGPLVDAVVAELEGTMREIRGFISRAPSEGVPPRDLPEVLRGFVNLFNRLEHSHVALEFDPSVTDSVDPTQAEHLLHIARESVSNAHRHGRASSIRIRFCHREDNVILAIEDDGLGFDPTSRSQAGRGLTSMAERAALCGGSLNIVSKIDGPTRVEVSLPKGASKAQHG